jgi:hypothetical protein
MDQDESAVKSTEDVAMNKENESALIHKKDPAATDKRHEATNN